MKIKSIIVLGGGSSGWCSASALAKFCPDLSITVIESDIIPTVGVGESTIQYFNTFAKLLGLNDKEWMPFCNATYKTAIKFTDFNKDAHYYAPFKHITNDNNLNQLLLDWSIISSIDSTITPDYFAKHIWPGTYLLDKNKLTDNDKYLNFKLEDNTSYNLDASKFGLYLREHYCKPKGVVHVEDTINQIIKNNDGGISELIGVTGKVYKADLFIDCTGFSSLLLEKSMGAEYKKYDELFNDKAVVFNSIPYTDKNAEMETYVNTIAKDYGWVWNIPLWNRISNGYVYSTKFTTDEQALEYLTTHVTEVRGKNIAESQKPFYVNIKNGRHEKAWIKNVIGIGLSYGFIEPLGSTGLLLTQRGIMRLVTQLNARKFDYNSFDVENFNIFYGDLIDTLKDFYLIHFITTNREDTPYWKYIKYDVIPNSKGFDAIRNKMSYILNDTSSYNPIDQYHWQICGMGYYSYNIEMLKNQTENGNMVEYGKEQILKFRKEESQFVEHVESLPTLFKYLKKHIYN
jgi:tryptophan halogenase